MRGVYGLIYWLTLRVTSILLVLDIIQSVQNSKYLFTSLLVFMSTSIVKE